jgi:hypothetical protein
MQIPRYGKTRQRCPGTFRMVFIPDFLPAVACLAVKAGLHAITGGSAREKYLSLS